MTGETVMANRRYSRKNNMLSNGIEIIRRRAKGLRYFESGQLVGGWVNMALMVATWPRRQPHRRAHYAFDEKCPLGAFREPHCRHAGGPSSPSPSLRGKWRSVVQDPRPNDLQLSQSE